MIERKNRKLAFALLALIACTLWPSVAAAQASPLTLPDAPIATASAPAADGGLWLFYVDGGAANLERAKNPAHLLVRTTVTTADPTVLSTEWKDREGHTWKVVTDCAGITIEECARRFEKAFAILSNLHPAAPSVP